MSTATQEVTSGYGVQPRYDLSVPEINDVTASFLQAETADLPDGRFIGVIVDHASPIANVARTTERRVFEDAFPGNDIAFMQREYGPYEDASRFLMVLDRRKRVSAGVMRIITDSEVGLKSLSDAAVQLDKTTEQIKESHGMQPGEKAWDIATLAVPHEYRSHGRQGVQPSLTLYRMLNTLGTQEGVQHLVAIVDEKALRTIKAVGVPFKAMCNIERGFEYLDSPKSQAVYGSLPEFQPAVALKSKEIRKNTGIGEIWRLGVRRFVRRHMLAFAAGRLASGKGIDGHISLPAA